MASSMTMPTARVSATSVRMLSVKPMAHISANVLMIDAGMAISDFNDEFRAALDDADYTTVGGFLFGRLGRLPRPGDVVEGGGLSFEIVSMAGRRVERVRVKRPAGAEPLPGAPGEVAPETSGES